MFDVTSILTTTTYYKGRDGKNATLGRDVADRMLADVRDALKDASLDGLADAYVQDRALVETSLLSEGMATTQQARLRELYNSSRVPAQMTELLLNTEGSQENAALERALAIHLLSDVLPHAAEKHSHLLHSAYTFGEPNVRDKLESGARGFKEMGIKDGWIYGRRQAYLDKLLLTPPEPPAEREPPARWLG